MLIYLDSSVLARAYLADEAGHEEAAALLAEPEHLLVTSSWTVVETISALTRACRSSCFADLHRLLAVLSADVGDDGPVTLLRAKTAHVELRVTEIVREHALHSLNALHVAVADIAARPLVEPDEPLGFASRDKDQRAAAAALGFVGI
ncbi:MAG: type II toxin-antitoxin system VapC family toxin [Mycobacteriales bacterium]